MKAYLITENSHNNICSESNDISEEERLVVSKYRKLSDKNKILVSDLISMLDK